MRMYIAGLFASNFQKSGNLYNSMPPNCIPLRDSITHYLESYHYIKKGRHVENIRKDGVRVFLDSGAFSAFTLGSNINLDEYAQFIEDNRDVIECASVLDAIGDPVGTFENQAKLEAKGLPVSILPCFHYGEPWDLAEYYVSRYPYITIGGMVPIPNAKLEIWLDELWSTVLTDDKGVSRTKVHGFGLTTQKLFKKYPWFSVDSSTWVQAAHTGSIILPQFESRFSISARSPSVKQFGQHFNTMPEASKDYIIRILEYYGLTLSDVQDDYKARWALNAFSFEQLGRMMGEDHWQKPFTYSQQGLFPC